MVKETISKTFFSHFLVMKSLDSLTIHLQSSIKEHKNP